MRALITTSLVLNALVLISFASIGAIMATEEEDGISVVVLFYALIIIAPIASIVTVALQARSSAGSK